MDAKDKNIVGYAAPTPEEIAARNKRSYAIAGALAAFCVFAFFLLLYQMGYFNKP